MKISDAVLVVGGKSRGGTPCAWRAPFGNHFATVLNLYAVVAVGCSHL